MSKNLKGNIILILAALIWGVSFVMQDKAVEYLSPFAINGIRSLIGSAVLLPVVLFNAKKSGRPFFEKTKNDRRDIIVCGILCGVFLCIATNFQQFGIEAYPENAAASGRSGFITALYVILVPLFSFVFKKKVSLNVWIGVALATVGMCFLCLSGGITNIYTGDIFVFCCAFAFTGQIMCIDAFADRVDGIKLSMLQFFVCGILSLILSLFFGKPSLEGVVGALPYILYLGIMSCGVAYTFQIIGQQYSKNPTVASILMSLESVFAALSGAVISGERLLSREIIGCALMFAAIVFAQLPSKQLKKVNKS